MRMNLKDALAGAFFFLFGAWYLVYSLQTLPIGTAFRMGPGFFPMLLGCLLIAFGVAVGVRALSSSGSSFGIFPKRALLLITISTFVFGLTVRTLGFIPATALTVLIAAYASRRMTLGFALALTVGLTTFSVLVFKVGLNLPLPLWGWYITR